MITKTLNLPEANLRISKIQNEYFVWDILRKKDVKLTPEEYVRQTFVQWLKNELHYPSSLMANEIGIEFNGRKRRCDTVVFSSSGKPLMIIEYKASYIEVNQEVFNQIVRYNSVLQAEYLIVTNGINHFCCKMDYRRNSYKFLRTIPDYKTISDQ